MHQSKTLEWTVDLEANTITHRDGWVFEVKQVEDIDLGSAWEAECIKQPQGRIDLSAVARLSRIAGEFYYTYLQSHTKGTI